MKSLADALKHLGCAGQDGVEHDIEIPVGKRVLRHPGLPTNKDLGVFWIEHHFDEPEVGREPKEGLNDRDVLRMTRREFKEISNSNGQKVAALLEINEHIYLLPPLKPVVRHE